jgi:sulfite reductase (NADPH) hemoprotein beta-component
VKERENGERFGDFTVRAGFIAKTVNGLDFHADTGAKRTS